VVAGIVLRAREFPSLERSRLSGWSQVLEPDRRIGYVVVSRWPSLQIKVTTVVEPVRDAARDLAVEALPGEGRP
jgi:hypothetical protein